MPCNTHDAHFNSKLGLTNTSDVTAQLRTAARRIYVWQVLRASPPAPPIRCPVTPVDGLYWGRLDTCPAYWGRLPPAALPIEFFQKKIKHTNLNETGQISFKFRIYYKI
jgi:hypothetical protein